MVCTLFSNPLGKRMGCCSYLTYGNHAQNEYTLEGPGLGIAKTPTTRPLDRV